MTNGSEESLRFRESFHTRIEALLEQAISQGADEETVTRAATEAINQSAEPLLSRLTEDKPRMLADHAAMWSDVERIINETWGEALDKLYSVIVCAEELGRIWNFANRYDAENDDDRIFGVMSGLLARATRAAFEVHLLLTRGFSAGASARARSVYELAVVARVMAEYGDTYDLPTRYRHHVIIDQYLWAKEHQDKAEELGREPLRRESISELERERNRLVEVYGEEFGKNYGWAAPLFSGGRIGISRLERMVHMDSGRPDYIAHSQEIHPTSWGADLNLERGNHVASWRLTGLAEAANDTMVHLTQVLSDSLVHGRSNTVNQYDLVGLTAVFRLVEDAEGHFVEADSAANERLLREPVHPQPPPVRGEGEGAEDGKGEEER